MTSVYVIESFSSDSMVISTKTKICIRNGIICLMKTFVFIIPGIDSDIIDEAIYYFKANVFFKNYEIKVRNHNKV